MKSIFANKVLWPGLKLIGLLLLVYYLVRDLNVKSIAQNVEQFPLEMFLSAFVVQILIQFVQSIRWNILLGNVGWPKKEIHGYIGLGQILSLVAPSSIVSDGLKAYLLGKRENNILKAVSSMFIGRVVGLAVLVIFFVVSIFFHMNEIKTLSVYLDQNSALIILSAFVVIFFVLYTNRKLKSNVLKLAEECRKFLANPKLLIKIFLLSLNIQLGLAVMSYIGFYYANTSVSFLNVLLLLPVITIASLVPVTIGQVGVRESLSVFFYGLVCGVSKEEIISIVVFFYILSLLVAVCNGMVVYFSLKNNVLQK